MVWLIYSLFLWCWQVVGELASQAPAQGHKLSGILVKRNFSFHLMTPKDLHSESKTTRTKNTWISCKELLQITMWETLFVIPTPVDRTKHNTATCYIIIHKKLLTYLNWHQKISFFLEQCILEFTFFELIFSFQFSLLSKSTPKYFIKFYVSTLSSPLMETDLGHLWFCIICIFHQWISLTSPFHIQQGQKGWWKCALMCTSVCTNNKRVSDRWCLIKLYIKLQDLFVAGICTWNVFLLWW